jgi:parvulin-like peptidyl-prolyl isomerase
MKKTVIALFLFATAAAASAAQVVEAIVVRVGDRIVTTTQYAKRLQDGLAEIDQTGPSDKAAARKEEFRKSLVNDIISELLIKDRADRLNLNVTDAEMKEALVRLKQQYNITTDEQFEQSLKSSGMTHADMEVRLRDTLLTNKVFAKELRNREELTDRELRDRYDREKEHYRLPERARLRAIILTKPDDVAAAARATTRADEIARDARAAPDFAKYAESVPENARKEKGGDMGEVARGELLPDLDKAVFNSASGAILGPIATKSGWHIIKVEQRLPSEVPAFESVKDKLRKDVSDEAFQRDYKAYIERLRKDAFIQINEQNVPTLASM